MKRCVAAVASLAVLVSCGGKAPEAKKQPGKLNIFIWSEYLPQEVVDEFQAKTGIETRVDLYDSNEALHEKLMSGVADYDLVVPSDYMVRILIQQGLLAKLDTSRLAQLANLDPRLMNQSFDPGNNHTLPYLWGTTGLGYDQNKVGEIDSWEALFDPKHKGRILMLDDMREVFAVALKSLGKSLNESDPAVLRLAAEKLKAQKALVKTYNSADFANILASGDVDFSHGYNGQLAEVVAAEPERLAFVVPREGATVWMDSIAIPAKARNVDSAYVFLDYILTPEVGAKIVNEVSYASANLPARQLIEPEILNDPAIFPSDETLARCEFIADVGEVTLLLDQLWTEIKAM